MVAISQTAFSNGFSWMKIIVFALEFHWNMFPGVQLSTCQHWIQMMTWHRTVNNPLSDPIAAQFTDVCMRHSVSISQVCIKFTSKQLNCCCLNSTDIATIDWMNLTYMFCSDLWVCGISHLYSHPSRSLHWHWFSHSCRHTAFLLALAGLILNLRPVVTTSLMGWAQT